MPRIALAVLCCIAPLLAQPTPLHTLFTDYQEGRYRLNPELASAAGRKEFADRWSDYSLAGLRAQQQFVESMLSRLNAIPLAGLSPQDALSYRVLRQQLEQQRDTFPLTASLAVVNQMFGIHLGVFSTVAQMPAATTRDYEQIVARLRALPAFVDGVIDRSNHAIELGILQPRAVVDPTLAQFDQQIVEVPGSSPLLAAFRRYPKAIPPAEQQQLTRAANDAYLQAFLPSWKRWRLYIRDRYAPKARPSVGLGSIPDGANRYASLVRQYTTTSLTPRQIHDIGQREFARIQRDMAAIRAEMRFTGTAEEFERQVLSAPALLYRSEDDMLVHARDIAKRIEPELPKLFRRLPRMPYGIRPIPADRAATSASNYQGPALDGTRAGYFNLRTYRPETQSRCCLEALILHEAVPGHHLQIALQAELESVPEFRRTGGFGAFVEGWALYAESLGDELGMYRDPLGRYGKLMSELFRAGRLVVDTGLHSLNWSRQQAIDFLMAARGGRYTAQTIESEIDRYIAIPGQALSYKIGELKIQELRALAEQKLGPRFDAREFHDVVLRNGALPLDLLEEQVRAYAP